MSEAESHLIKQRMQAGRVDKARRGELAMTLPIGYWRRPSGDVVFDPDEQIQAVVKLIFAKFTELGSIQGVVRHLVEHGITVGETTAPGPGQGHRRVDPPGSRDADLHAQQPGLQGSTPTAAAASTPPGSNQDRPATGRRCKHPASGSR